MTIYTEDVRTMDTMPDFRQSAEDYKVVAKAIHYLDEHFRRQPELAEVAAHVGLSEFYFQRLFSRWVGISPKRFI